jgi:hypothetical protein
MIKAEDHCDIFVRVIAQGVGLVIYPDKIEVDRFIAQFQIRHSTTLGLTANG